MRRTLGIWAGLLALTVAVAWSAVRAESGTVKPSAAGKRSLQTLSGPLPRFVKASGSPYLVTANIEVPSQKTVVIEPGTVLLFKNFCGLHVQGRLIAEGTKSSPIVFTSEYDRRFNPASERDANPFDWDGLYIHPDGFGTRLAYAKIFYSVYGFVSETKYIRLDPVVFRDNGQSRVTIEKTEHGVSEEPFKYALSTKEALQDGVPVDIVKDPAASRRNFLRYAGFAVLVGGAALGAYEVRETRAAQQRLDALGQLTDANLIANDEEAFEQARRSRDRQAALSIASFGLGVLGLIGFGWSFNF